MKKTILDKSLNFITIKEKDETLLMNFTHKHAEHSKINNYKSVYVGNDAKYIKLCWHEEYDLFFTVDDFIKWIIGNKMKFDKVIMNPPYDGNLHLKILEQVLQSCPDADIVCLQPNNHLVNIFDAWKWNDRNEDGPATRTTNHLIKYETISKYDAAKIFSIGTTSIKGLIIGLYKKRHSLSKTNSVAVDMHIYAKVVGGQGTGRKSLNMMLQPREKLSKNAQLIVCVYSKDDNVDWKEKLLATSNSNVSGGIDFASAKEKRNFVASLDLNLMKWIGQFHNSYGPMALPWLGDYTSLWTNERLYKYFNLTDDEIKYIEDTCK